MTERRPATEAGREMRKWFGLSTHPEVPGDAEAVSDFNRRLDEAILAIEAQATDARVAALREALTDLDAAWVWVRDNSPATLRAMPTETFRAFDRIQRFLADLPAAAAEREVDALRAENRQAVVNAYDLGYRNGLADSQATKFIGTIDADEAEVIRASLRAAQPEPTDDQ